jgi:hypothetical protein
MSVKLASFTNADDGVTAVVVASGHGGGGHGVCVRDDDAGMFIGASIHGLTFDDAIEKAKRIAGV